MNKYEAKKHEQNIKRIQSDVRLDNVHNSEIVRAECLQLYMTYYKREKLRQAARVTMRSNGYMNGNAFIKRVVDNACNKIQAYSDIINEFSYDTVYRTETITGLSIRPSKQQSDPYLNI